MKTLLALVAIVGVVCGAVLADPLVLNPTKDADISNYSPGEANMGWGGVGSYRIINANYDGLYDFDTHVNLGGGAASALTAWMGVNLPTYAATGAGAKQAMLDGKLTVQMGVAQSGGGLSGRLADLRLVNAPVDWTEGNGNRSVYGWQEFNWAPGTLSVTQVNPNQIWSDTTTGLPVPLGNGWGLAGDQTCEAAAADAGIVSVVPMTWDANGNSYGFADLTPDGVLALMDTATNRGLLLRQNGSSTSNSAGFFKEGGANVAPEMIFTAVPEPATMGLLLIGGIGALLRRRK